jgi:indolepyruvate ferredoxin oxidoreductase
MTLADDRAHAPFSLDDRYTRDTGTVYLTGIQALVRMIADRAVLDRRSGRRTASFVSGYEGSPLAGYDLEIARRRSLLDPLDIVHRPALNEEIAATSVMGSQIAARVGDLAADSTGQHRDGIVGYWYGKAPGLDRATDALRHANLVGTHPNGGAVALVGDDPGAKSSTVPCASEMALADLYIPILYPADSADILTFGVHAALMSRTSGLWTSLKISAHVADGASTAVVGPDTLVPDFGGLGTSPHVPSGMMLGANLMELEQNQLTIRLPRAREYARLTGSASSRPARPISTCARPCATSGSPTPIWATWASASSSSAWSTRWRPTFWTGSSTASTRSSSSRRSATSSRR